jgi:hypothetical protein
MEFREIEHVMTNIQPVKSLSEYISAVNHISHTFTDHLWYRGHSKDTYLNLPKILRKQTWVDDDYSYRTEYDIFKTFKRKCRIQRETDYEYLHLMQHFGLPTRLLDWTESSLTALFFAIKNSEECKQPLVWILDPWDFNKILHHEKVVFDFYGQAVHKKVDSYINPLHDDIDNMPDLPIAVMPSFYDERVIAQKSGFILFGKNDTPLEELVKRGNYFNLAKINIDTESASDILTDLIMAGVDFHSVFPDLFGLVNQIKMNWNLK